MNLDTPAALTNNIFKSFSASKLKIVSLDVRYTVRKSSKLSLSLHVLFQKKFLVCASESIVDLVDFED